jgi:hypothetical protein
MAKVERNPLLQGIRGTLGNVVFRQMPDGSTWISGIPDFSRRTFSQGQKEHQSRFKEAAAYARSAAKTESIYARLAKGTTKNAYNIALSDWFNPPVIHFIERRVGRILVNASDNVMVTRVHVQILDVEGNTVQEGNASPMETAAGWWELPIQTEGRTIVAEAWDLAGNVTEAGL